MAQSLKFFGMAGSLREQANSRIVLNALGEMLPELSQLLIGDIGQLPFYNVDVELSRLPAAVSEMRSQVETSDAVLIVTPEYNHSIPGVLKNALDWLSRPAFKSCMTHKPVFFITLSESAMGGVRAQLQLREILASMLCTLPPLPEIAMAAISSKIRDGKLTDEPTLKFTRQVLNTFLASAVK